MPKRARDTEEQLPRWDAEQIEGREKEPLQLLIDAESKSDVWVRVFLTGCRPWPAARDTQGRCGVCHDLPLLPGWYCGACDRPKGSQARRGAVAAPPIKMSRGKRVKPETRRERRQRKREAA